MNITYRKPVQDDIVKINNFVADIFNKVEPVSESIGLCRDCMLNWANSPAMRITEEAIESNLSLIAEHEGEIVGVRLISICERPKDIVEDDDISYKCCDKCSKKEDDFNRFLKMLSKVRNQVWKLTPPDVVTIAHREISGVKKEYQRKGIGKQLAEKDFSDEYLKTLGIHGIVSETTSIANQNLLKSLGFKPLTEEKYSDYNIFPTDGCKSLILNFKKL
uniref:C2H2-type domain-containing protein n=1 Tax=Strongyloides stercoralis TaxID=6248 RepID=A0A0K0EGI7_STRER